MRQAHLGGRTKGLRPGQQRQLDRLSQRRHPEDSGADLLTLERLAKLVDELELSMHLVLDGRGLCRLLWLGPLTGSDNLREHLPSAPRRSSGGWRLVSCPFQRQGLASAGADAVVALDLAPRSWLRYTPRPGADGLRQAELLQPDRQAAEGVEGRHREERVVGAVGAQRPARQRPAPQEGVQRRPPGQGQRQQRGGSFSGQRPRFSN